MQGPSPGDELPADLAQFAGAFRELSDWIAVHAPRRESRVFTLLHEHFGADPQDLPLVSETVPAFERPNLQVALDAYLAGDGRSAQIVGLSVLPGYRQGLAMFANRKSPWGVAPEPGPVEYVTVRVGEREIACLASALLLVVSGGVRLAVFTRHDEMHGRQGLQVEVMALEAEHAASFLGELREQMNRHNVYRGHILALANDPFGDTSIVVESMRDVKRAEIVLPEGVLERVERHTIEFAREAERLRGAGRHLRRGLMLHGPPGTGKTLCAMYLVSHMPERTTLLLTGQGLAAIAASCEMARRLQPATVVLEDVDLVAMNRQLSQDPNSLLFQLLNEMDGMEQDTDVLFVMTTNRAEVVEPALAQRPGRVDEAVELPLPDAEGRLRLLNLYGRDLGLAYERDDPLVKATDGVSPAFIRELLRRAALLATLDGAEISDRHVTTALAELEEAHSRLTRRLLGAGS